jgi:acetyl/propionyl-CoA carboxylase alpha subunit
VSTHYDSLLSKICAWGATRAQALDRMRRALAEYALSGPTTSLEFHLALLDHPAFVTGVYDTGFVDRHTELLQSRAPTSVEMAALAVASQLDSPARVPRAKAASRWGVSFRS